MNFVTIPGDQILERGTLPGEIAALSKLLSRYTASKIYSVYKARFIGLGLHFAHQCITVFC